MERNMIIRPILTWAAVAGRQPRHGLLDHDYNQDCRPQGIATGDEESARPYQEDSRSSW